MKKAFRKLFSLHFPQALAVIFLVVIVMTIWWQFLFNKILNSYVEGKKAELAGKIHQTLSLTKNDRLKNIAALEKSQQALMVATCSLKPCLQVDKQQFLQIHPNYEKKIGETRARTLSTFYWETAFLMTVLLIGFTHLIYTVLREKRQNQERLQFLAMATHELKRPINSTSLVLQSLKRKSLPAEREREFIDKGLKDIANMSKQIERLLKTQELQIISPEPEASYKISEFISNIVNEFNLQSNRIQFANHLEQKKDSSTLNKPALRTLISNIIENALHYSEKEVQVQLTTAKGATLLEIVDGGIGFTEAELKNIGKPFHRSSEHKVQNTAGSGIGLFIVKKVALALDLDLEIKSTGRNKGTQVKLFLT